MTAFDDAYRASVRAVRERVDTFARSRFTASGAWHTVDEERFVRELVPVVQAGQYQVAALSDRWLASQLTVLLGRRIAPLGMTKEQVTGAALRNGTTLAEEYARPYVTTRYSLSRGNSFTDAVGAGLARTSELVSTDMQLAATHTYQQVLDSHAQVYGYARVPGGAKPCWLCLTASQQVYRTSNLMPIHVGCSCSVQALTSAGAVDVPDAPSQTQIDTAAREAGVTNPAADLRVAEHGEIGPVLVDGRYGYTGPGDIAA